MAHNDNVFARMCNDVVIGRCVGNNVVVIVVGDRVVEVSFLLSLFLLLLSLEYTMGN